MAAEDNARMPELNPELVEKTIELTRLLLAFGLTNRATHHADQITRESDTDHTVMLGIIACAFAAKMAPRLDQGKIAQFALVHDLVEVYAGDTPTMRIMSEEDTQKKKGSEEAALERIKNEYADSYPWIHETIEEYESLATPEARFVKVVDKALPKFVHIINQGTTARSLGHTRESATAFHEHQNEKLGKTYGSDQPEAMALLCAAVAEELKRTVY
jgi:putative hydrolase of HD superfamily